MGARFPISLFGAFVAALVILIGAGYSVTKIVVQPPRDPFRAGSFEFDLAPGWWCEHEGSEYVCSPLGKPPYAAIAVIAVKERNNQDNLADYEEHLKKPQKPSTGPKDTGRPSEVR